MSVFKHKALPWDTKLTRKRWEAEDAHEGNIDHGDLTGVDASAHHIKYTDAEAKAAAVSDTAYDATSWDGVTDVAPSKNAVRDKIEALSGVVGDVFAKAHLGWSGATESQYGWLIDAATEIVAILVQVPGDFTALDNLLIAIHSMATNASMDFRIDVKYGKDGEVWGNHINAGEPSHNVTSNYRHEVDISYVVVSQLAADDYIHIEVKFLNDTNAYILGARLKYH